jgi:hypothetical protein
VNHEPSRAAALKATSLITIAVYVLLSGGGPKTIWSAEARSPDGHWVASARTDQHSGPGNAGLYTTVEMRRTSGSKSPMEIFLLDYQAAYPFEANVKMIRLTPSHLEMAYNTHADIDFQAVNCAGIDISVRELPSGSSDHAAP